MRRRLIANTNKGFTPDNYLTIEALEDNLTATFTNDVEYAIDGDEWVKLASGSETQPINVGQTLSFRGELKPNRSNGIGTFKINKKCNLKGNCMSMLFGDNASDNYSLSGKNYAFYNLFYNCKNIVNVSSNFLPATTLAIGCYFNMFQSCTSLTIAPELPATTLADYCYFEMFDDCKSLTTAPSALPATTLASNCYEDMFYGCKSLTTAPALPATTLADRCYGNMFLGCTSLITAPELPATNLKGNCYYQMFYGCTKLNYIKCLATDISAYNCTYNWVSGVSATGTFVKAAGMTKWTTGNSGIPTGWTVENNQEPLTFNILSDGTINWTASKASITKTIEYKLNNGEWTSIISNTGSSAPTINVIKGDKVQFRGNNAQYATEFSVYNSFSGSTALFEAEGNIMSLIYGDDFKNKLTISSAYTFTGLFRDCANLVSAENLILPATTLVSNCYQNMFRNCSSLTVAPELPVTTLASNCYSAMFADCTSLKTAPALPATTLAERCYVGMFYDCTSLTTAPELPATTLAKYCYASMFYKCTKLNYIKCLATDISASNCISSWVDGVASTGTFVKAASMNGWTTGSDGIPRGWTVQNA